MSKKRVRTLLRVSSKQQLHDDDIPIQRAEANGFIAKHSDWEFDKEYIEKAVSAYKNSVEDREILMEILADAKKNEFEVLLTYMSDRIGRKEEYSFYVATLNSLGIEVWTIKDGQLKTEEHVDKLLNFIRFWQNEGESRKTSMRVRDAQKEMVQAGKFVGGKAPFGYKLVLSGEISNHGRALHKLEIVPENAAIVQKIYSLAIHQGFGAEKIAKQLNADGIPAITTDKWKNGTISSILKNPIYMGYPAVGRRVNHGSFTRLDRKDWTYAREQQTELVIVSQREWERAQELREARKSRIEASKDKSRQLYEKQQSNLPFSTSGKLPLIGIAHCGYCGKKLKNASYNNRWYSKKEGKEKVAFAGRYLCPSKCEERAGYSQKYLENIVFEVVDEYMERLKTINIADEIKAIQDQQRGFVDKGIKKLQKQKRAMEEDINTLNENIPQALRGDYMFSAEQLSKLIKKKEEGLKKLEAEIKEMEQELEAAKISSGEMQQFINIIPNWKEEFHQSDTATKQMLLATLIERIDVKDDDIKIRFRIRLEDFYPMYLVVSLYRNKGFDFTITSSTAYDHKWMYGRNYFESISEVVDELFGNFLSRPNVKQPILTQYCDGERVTCPNWLSQWGSKYLGDQNYSAVEIIRYYYGNDMYINEAQEIAGVPASWPGQDLTIGSSGDKVRQMQEQLNRIAQVYTSIPKIAVDGAYGPATAEAVRQFQTVFGLPATGVVDYPTWYKISEIYVGVTRIAELY